MKTKFTLITDTVFVGLITFILSLVIFNYCVPHPISVTFAGITGLCFCALYCYRTNAKNKTEKLKRREKKECAEVCAELNFSERAEQIKIIEQGLNKAGYAVEKRRGMISLKEKNVLISVKFGFEKANKADIVRAFNVIEKGETAYILAENFEHDIIAFANRFGGRVVLSNGQAVYKFLKRVNALPERKYKDYYSTRKRASFINLLDKKKSKNFFAFGVAFLGFSYFSPIKIYYLACGCSFLIYSLVLRLFGKSLTPEQAKTGA